MTTPSASSAPLREQNPMTAPSRAVFVAALIGGVTFFFSHRTGVDGAALVAWKGTGVGFLALWCALQARDVDGWMIAAVMAFGAIGDMLLEAVGLTVGALAFVVGHVIAMVLYLRNPRVKMTGSQRLLGLLVVPLSVLIAVTWVPLKDALGVGIYAVFMAGMAASAWASRFPRYRVGIGAMMFLASDLLIFARMGWMAESAVPGLLIWPLYFAGQVLIAYGVVRTLRGDPAQIEPQR